MAQHTTTYTELRDYVADSLERGVPAQTLRRALARSDWDDALVERAFADVARRRPEILASPTSGSGKPGVFTAFGDGLAALRYNRRASWVSIGIICVAALVGYAIVHGLQHSILQANTDFVVGAEATYVSRMVLVVLLGIAWFLSAGSWLVCTCAAAIGAGRDRTVLTTGQLLSRSRQRVPRAAGALALVLAAVVLPLFVGTLLTWLVWSLLGRGSVPFVDYLVVIDIAGVVWVPLAAASLSLAVYGAVYEPDVPLRQVLRRSLSLIRSGGVGIVARLLLMLAIVLGAASLLLGQDAWRMVTDPNFGAQLVYMAASVYTVIVLAVVYLVLCSDISPRDGTGQR